MGFVAAINKSVSKGHTVRLNEPGKFIEGFGLEGDSHGGRNNRQVSLFGQASIRQMEKMGAKGLCTARFNENIMTEDIRLFELPVGTRLKIGETIQEISQIGKKCHGCEIAAEKGECTLVNEVVFTSVIKGGMIKVGDLVEVLES
ncbi:MOSC domain-containing protein [Acetobacterium paludosum]|uniref:MOSC domain-containing protein n=1 Tax=Acetobacterium paludosum TaxID=52693 RepID=A0A923HVR4_9FIRM|nr:MOSC domain-containing protein [Acetobacterium paludosum]MBC3888130.1 MOSC domain-containing protein [Acetobacterium paludosum]